MISSISGVTDITKTLLSGGNISIDIQTVRLNNLCCYQVSLISLSHYLSICQKNGWSALFFAADKGDVATTKLLLKAGADPLLRDNVRKCKRDYCRNDYSITILLSLVFQSGLTAVDVASAGENDDVYGLLRNHMRTTNTLQSRVSQVRKFKYSGRKNYLFCSDVQTLSVRSMNVFLLFPVVCIAMSTDCYSYIN